MIADVFAGKSSMKSFTITFKQRKESMEHFDQAGEERPTSMEGSPEREDSALMIMTQASSDKLLPVVSSTEWSVSSEASAISALTADCRESQSGPKSSVCDMSAVDVCLEAASVSVSTARSTASSWLCMGLSNTSFPGPMNGAGDSSEFDIWLIVRRATVSIRNGLTDAEEAARSDINPDILSPHSLYRYEFAIAMSASKASTNGTLPSDSTRIGFLDLEIRARKSLR
mmetsp:Transcript_10820/g.29918  ORF Transcript_10820/g.29918 Transcript_10820/m.29918 type:complete len:228 (-) Transcript_10820:3092-3775(-)